MRYIRSFTLQDLCLGRIIEHLDCFIKYKDFIPERHINFLLRLYSKECFTQHTSLHSRTEECLLWFLNSSNKNVFLPDITHSIVERLQIVGPAITSLNLKETMAPESLLNSVLCCVPHLSHLDLSDSSCSNNTLLCIQKMCPDLVTLNIQGCSVNDQGMLNLCENKLSLKNLNILNTDVEPMGVMDILRGMPSLQCLTYDNFAEEFYGLYSPFHAYDVRNNVQFNLTELIYEYMFEDPIKVISIWIALCPNVEKVHIMFPVKRKILDMCSRFQRLKEFVYQSKRYEFNASFSLDPLTPLLSRAKDITTLKLSRVKINSVVLLECFKNVKHLHLNGVTFTNFTDDEIISKNTNLDSLTIKDLNLNETGDTYKTIALLFSLSKDVSQLVISKMSYFPADLIDIILNSMTNLTFIEFSFITSNLPSSLFKFFEIPTVQRVYLDGCMDDMESNLGPVHFSTDSCTLAWRIMNDIEDDIYNPDDEDVYDYCDDSDDDDKYYYYDMYEEDYDDNFIDDDDDYDDEE